VVRLMRVCWAIKYRLLVKELDVRVIMDNSHSNLDKQLSLLGM
jgi:hypothetical protein